MAIRKKTIASAGKDVEKLEPAPLLVGMENGTAISESSRAVPRYVKHETAIMTQQFHSQEFRQENRQDSSHKSS